MTGDVEGIFPISTLFPNCLEQYYVLVRLQAFNTGNSEGKILNLGNAGLIQIVFTGLEIPEREQPYQCSWLRKWVFLPLSFAARI